MDAKKLASLFDNTNFAKWFGGSKVVDESGFPLIVHHGTPNASPDVNKRYLWAKDKVASTFADKEREETAKIIQLVADRLGVGPDSKLRTGNVSIEDVISHLGLNDAETALYNALPSQRNPFHVLEENAHMLAPEDIERLTEKKFSSFDIGKAGANTQAHDAKAGAFFTPDNAMANWFTKTREFDPMTGQVKEIPGINPATYSVYLSMKNPLDLRNMPLEQAQHLIDSGLVGDMTARELRDSTRNMAGSKDWQQFFATRTGALKDAGYDGILNNVKFGGKKNQEYIAFEPTQIKSVNNRGTFDPNDPNIYRAALPFAAGAGLMSMLPSDAEAVQRIREKDAPLEDAWNPLEAFAGGVPGGLKAAAIGVLPDGAMDWAFNRIGGLMSGGGK